MRCSVCWRSAVLPLSSSDDLCSSTARRAASPYSPAPPTTSLAYSGGSQQKMRDSTGSKQLYLQGAPPEDSLSLIQIEHLACYRHID